MLTRRQFVPHVSLDQTAACHMSVTYGRLQTRLVQIQAGFNFLTTPQNRFSQGANNSVRE